MFLEPGKKEQHMCSEFLARLRGLQSEFQDFAPFEYAPAKDALRTSLQRFAESISILTPTLREMISFPNDFALLLAVLVEVPLRGLGPFTAPIESFDDPAWATCMIRLASHAGVLKLVQDVLGSGCLGSPAQQMYLRGFADILVKHAPVTHVSSRKKADSVFTERRKQALTRGFESGFAKMKLREGQVSGAHKKRADAAHAKRMGTGAGASAAGAALDGLTAFLTSDWDGEDGVYSDSDEDDHHDLHDHAFADVLEVIRCMQKDDGGETDYVGRMLAFWFLEGLPQLTPTQMAQDVMGALDVLGSVFPDHTYNGFLAEYLRRHVDTCTQSPKPVLVHKTVLHLAFREGSLLLPRGYKYVATKRKVPFVPRFVRLGQGLAAVLLEKAGVTVSTGRLGGATVRLTVQDLLGLARGNPQLVDWAETNALVILNDELLTRDTWVPVEVFFRLQGALVPAFVLTPPDAPFKDIEWQPTCMSVQPSGLSIYSMLSRPTFAIEGRPAGMTVAQGLAWFHDYPVTAKEVEQRIKEGDWRPFRSLDAGLAAAKVVTFAEGDPRSKAAEDASLSWTFAWDRKQKQHTAERMEDMIRALCGFVDSEHGEPIKFVSEGMRERQADQLVPLIIDLHRGTYERFLAAGSAADVAVLLATSLPPKILWYTAVIALSPDQTKHQSVEFRASEYARHAAFLQDVRRAAVAIVEAIPGPCFPVRLNLGPKTVWELRPRRHLHNKWFVDVPMHLPAGYAGIPSAMEPTMLPADFFVYFMQRESQAGFLRCRADVHLRQLMTGTKTNPLELERYGSMVRQFLWHSAGLACVAPAALLFFTQEDLCLCARLQLLWSGTEDVDINPVTYNNVLTLLHVDDDPIPVPKMPASKRWMEDNRASLHLPASGMGLREGGPMRLRDYPALDAIPKSWTREHEAFVKSFGVPLDDYSRMDMDAAVAAAPDDVKVAALRVRAALLEGDRSDSRLQDEIDRIMLNPQYMIVVLGACFRTNGVLPLRESLFATFKHKGGIDYKIVEKEATHTAPPPL